MMGGFRTKVKSWNALWWVVLVAFVIGNYARRAPRRSEQPVVTVNGKAVTVADVAYSFGTMKRYADYFAKIYGMVLPVKDLQERALKKCITEKLVDEVVASSGFELDPTYFHEQLVQTLPDGLIEPTGKVNLLGYKQYLGQMHLTIDAYEARVEQELKRSEVSDVIKHAGYVSKSTIKDIIDTLGAKSFYVVKFPLHKYMQVVTQTSVDDTVLESYYQTNKEAYRVEDKSKAVYTIVDADKYDASIDVDEESIERFYAKNKDKMFKTPLTLKVRRILFGVAADASAAVLEQSEKKAREVLVLAQKSGSDFAALAKQYSEDSDSASKGGMLEPFSRGTHDREFESVAFRLKDRGQISDLVRTRDGFEIIRLEERIDSSEKPLSSVRREVTDLIKTRKAKNLFQNDLDTLTREVRENKEALAQFAQTKNLKLYKTEWLGAQDTKLEPLEQALATKLAAKAKQGGSFGSFTHEGKTIIYQRTDFAKSYIPEFVAVKDAVRADYEREEALKFMKKEVKEARSKILSGKVTLEGVADELGLRVITTSFGEKEKAKLEGRSAVAFFDKAYQLNDPSLMVEIDFDDNFHLVQLAKAEGIDSISFVEQAEKIAKQEKSRQNDLIYQGFIASLVRTAKIEQNDNVNNESAVEVSGE